MSDTILLRRRKRDPKPETPSEPRTPKTMLRTGGRWLLWAAIAIVVLRGLDATFSSPPEPVAAPAPTVEGADQRAAGTEAFAEQYARAYFTHTSSQAADRERLAQFTPQDAETGLQAPEAKPSLRSTVTGTTIVGTEKVTDTTARVTVLATTSDGPRQLTVPVTRTKDGALAILEPARPAPAPRLAATDPPELEALPGAVRSSVTPTLVQSLRAYLAGDPDALRFLTAPGATINPAGGYQLQDVTGVLERKSATKTQRFLAVTAVATDAGKVSHTFAFDVTVQYANDRWLLERIA